MASPLTRSHIEGERRLRVAVADQVQRIWRELPGHDRANVDEWLSKVLPLIAAGQRASVSLTDAYIARSLERQPLGLNADDLIGAAVRNGTPPETVYERPFVTTWTALASGALFDDAIASGMARAAEMARFDVQASMRAAAGAVQAGDDGIYGYQRVADGAACAFCLEIDGAYVKSADAMPLHPGCVTGDSVVWVPPGLGSEPTSFGRAHAATRRWYEGQVVVLKTAAGHELTVTPNHPVLTERGWVAAHLLREGDSVISSLRIERVGRGVPNEEHVPACIEDRFRAGLMGPLTRVPFAAEQFHGDRGDGEVDVVALHGGLDAGMLTSILQPFQHSRFSERTQISAGLSCTCGRRERFLAVRNPGFRRVRRRYSRQALLSTLQRCGDSILLRDIADRYPRLFQAPRNDAAVDAMFSRQHEHGGPVQVPLNEGRIPARDRATTTATRHTVDVESAENRFGVDADDAGSLLRRLSREVQSDSLVLVRRRNVATHVFNLVTGGGWYMANSIVTHNCGCGLEPLTAPHPRAAKLPSGVAVRQHGEMGPVLGSPEHDFTSAADIPAL